MPAYSPSPWPDLLPLPDVDAVAADGDQPMLGYECAMPWFQVAALAAEPVSAPWPANQAG